MRLPSLQPNTQRTQSASSPSTRFTLTTSSDVPDLGIPQLISVKTLINDSLDIIDVSRWTGQSTNASFISGQLKLLHDHLKRAKSSLKGLQAGEDMAAFPGGEWWTNSAEENTFEPHLPGSLSLHFTIQDANLVLTIRTLIPASPSNTPTGDGAFSLSGLNLRGRLLGLGPRQPTHDEVGVSFQWRGKHDANVREKVRVESGDPSLISVAAKLSALEHEVSRWRENLRIVMEESDEEDD